MEEAHSSNGDWSDWREQHISWGTLARKLTKEQWEEVQPFRGQDWLRIESEKRRQAFEQEMELVRKRFESAEAERLLDVVYPFGRRVWVCSPILFLPSLK